MERGKSKSSGVSCEEVGEIISAFEKDAGCRVSVELSVGILAGKRSLQLVAWAWNNQEENPAPPLLASASVRCSALRMATIEGAIIRVLYALDSQLAWQGVANSKPEEGTSPPH